jgi:hypothetical protein
MKVKALNVIKRKNKKWEYNGRFYYNKEWIPVIGTIPEYKTDSQIKRAIIKKIKGQAEKYKADLEIPKEKVLPADTVFKVSL